MVNEGAFDSVGNLLQGGELVFDLIANLSKKTKQSRRKLDRRIHVKMGKTN